MRKRYRVLWLAAMVAAIIVPFGFALSLEPASIVRTEHLRRSSQCRAPHRSRSTSVGRRRRFSATLPFKTGVPDSARLSS